ncbi:MAG: hypothetical protein ACE5JI_07020 [Acidobacteriota bacterium]
MEKTPRHYMALAFLPFVLAIAALTALYLYQQGAEERRDGWQKPDAVFEALGIEPGMEVGQLRPSDTYFLSRLARRVGPRGKVYAMLAPPGLAREIGRGLPQVHVEESPSLLDVILLLHLRATEQDLEKLERELHVAKGGLKPGGRLGLIGVRSDQLRGFLSARDAAALAERVGFHLVQDAEVVERQFLLVLESSREG